MSGTGYPGYRHKVQGQVEAAEPEADRATEIEPMGSAPPPEGKGEVGQES